MIAVDSTPLKFRDIIKMSSERHKAMIHSYLAKIDGEAFMMTNPHDSSIVIVDFANKNDRDDFSSKFGTLAKKTNTCFSKAA